LPSLPASTSGQQFESDLRRLGNPDSAKMRPALVLAGRPWRRSPSD
jgi:hypothetical protein